MKNRPTIVTSEELSQLSWDTGIPIEFEESSGHLIHEGREYVAPLPSAVA